MIDVVDPTEKLMHDLEALFKELAGRTLVSANDMIDWALDRHSDVEKIHLMFLEYQKNEKEILLKA